MTGPAVVAAQPGLASGLLLGLGLLLMLMLGLRALGGRRWAEALRGPSGELEAGRRDAPRQGRSLTTRYDLREIAGLPAPVQRYFRAVLRDGQPIITAVTMASTGTFNLSPTGERWKPFTAQQRVIARRPGFLWDARIALLPGVVVRVVDSYIGGVGWLHAAVLGLFTMARQRGGGEIARGECLRWFAEAAWYPTALLPSQGVRWAAVDGHSARATLVDGAVSLSLLFRFDEAGLIASFHAEARGSMVGSKQVMAPWEGRWSDYRLHEGVRVPWTGEVAWLRPEGRRLYFVGTLTTLHFELAA